jgi:formylglycine-generating enzyme required for sulfatase activity
MAIDMKAIVAACVLEVALTVAIAGCSINRDKESNPGSKNIASSKASAETPTISRDQTSPPAASKEAGEIDRIPNNMVLVPGENFFMGVDRPEHGEAPGELTLVGSFLIDRTEVTADQYIRCREEKKCDTADLMVERGCNATSVPPRLMHPMNCVTWHQAVRYCESHGKRLPTSSEWELAARGTDRRPYPWGPQPPSEQLCWQGRKGKARSTTCPVGSFPDGASPYGVLDMAGNVSEYTSTVQAGAYPPPIYQVRGGNYVHDPLAEAESSTQRVDLGGAGSGNPNYPQVTVGFRCAQRLAPQ